MSEKLVIKNFGTIKHVDLDIKKVNVLIGDQGTGKSTVAKVLAIFRDSYFHIIKENYNHIDHFEDYGILTYFNKETFLEYNCNLFDIVFFDSKFNIKYYNGIDLYINELERILNSYDENNADIKLDEYKNLSNKVEDIFAEEILYIPAERVLVPIISNSSFSFLRNKIALPEYLSSFGEDFQIARRNTPNKRKIEYLDIEYIYNNNIDYISGKNFSNLKLTEAATGYLSSVPLFLVVDGYSSDITTNTNETAFFVVEEPEISLFPQTQYKLIQFLISKTLLNDKYLITTHSPYILTSLNNLMQAFIVGENNSEKVNEIIEKKYWLNPKDVSAYMLTTDGFAENIIAEDGLIMTEKIDAVSDVLNGLYDKLLDIKYSNSQ
ncbi:MAG: AAA family ATPase [Chitinophagales bacterium]